MGWIGSEHKSVVKTKSVFGFEGILLPPHFELSSGFSPCSWRIPEFRARSSIPASAMETVRLCHSLIQ
jgi:hypothetical protein